MANPQAYVITKIQVTPESTLPVTMAPGGGFAVSFRKL
ncbi:MAG: glycoside hydrolase family 97 C-terminal domain-containing protein [Bacteroidales bacterium]|nr:glycoside hydrolase family 97 C-terminal domain-containing protein [Bacteroidales bacterium]